MKRIRISKNDAVLYYRLELLGGAQSLLKAMEAFRLKYNQEFVEFEKNIHKDKKENFEKWDDYLEWKSYWKAYQEKLQEIKDLESETDIEVVTE